MGCPRFIRFQVRVWYCLLPTTQSNGRRQQPVPSQTLTFPATIPIQTEYIHMISHKPIISLSTTFKFSISETSLFLSTHRSYKEYYYMHVNRQKRVQPHST